VPQCYICGTTITQSKKCILCDEYVCEKHSDSFEVGQEKSDIENKKIYAYICERCMEAVEELKRKPREKWTEEDKTKSKGMIGKILGALGKAGMIIIASIFAFALWLFTKGERDTNDAGFTNIPESETKLEFQTESTGETSFTEESTFKKE
jgi:hypothetical protein